MPKKTLFIVSLACLVLILVGGYFVLWSEDDGQVINGKLDRLVELAAKTEDESFIIGITQSREIARFFAEDAEVEFGSPLPVISGRSELEGIIIQVRQGLQMIDIGIGRRELVVAENAETARMNVEAEGRVNQAGDPGLETRAFTIDWVKQEGDWLIRTVTLDGGF